jgi:K+-sensing histidine kinase KdpD
VAHELRGPLTALETASEVLDRDFEVLDPQQMRAMISSIHRRALWLRGLMENLLCTATIRDGNLSIHRRPLDLREIVDEVAALLQPLVARKDQRVRVHASVDMPLVAADTHRVTQVLLNLVSNAHKYSPSGTTILVVVSARGGSVRVTVADRGTGVSAANAGQLFEPYYRAGLVGGEGLGIGLSVVRSIVEAHGGTVGFANRRSGGSAFWVELPAMGTTMFIDDAMAKEEVVG